MAETYIFFDMENGLTLTSKGDKMVYLKAAGTSMRCALWGRLEALDFVVGLVLLQYSQPYEN